MFYGFYQHRGSIFDHLDPAIQKTINTISGGCRTIAPDEFFFPTQESAKQWAEEDEYHDAGYIVGIIVILVLPDGQRIGLTTTAQFDRAEQ